MTAARTIIRLCRFVLGGVLIALAVPPAIWGIWLLAIMGGPGSHENSDDFYFTLGGTGLYIAALFATGGILVLLGTVRKEVWLLFTVVVTLSAGVPYAGLPIRETGYFVNLALALLALLAGNITVLVWKREVRCVASLLAQEARRVAKDAEIRQRLRNGGENRR